MLSTCCALSPRKRRALVRKTLASAVANAENNNNLNLENLVIQEAVVGEGPTAKRFQPKARGSAGPIRKRTSHIRIILTDEIEIKRREQRDRKKSKKSSSTKPAKGKSRRKETKEAQAAQPEAAPESKE